MNGVYRQKLPLSDMQENTEGGRGGRDGGDNPEDRYYKDLMSVDHKKSTENIL